MGRTASTETPDTEIDRLILARGLTREKVSKSAGFGKGLIGEIVSGKTRHPRALTLSKLAAVLNVEKDDLFDDEGRPLPANFEKPAERKAAQMTAPTISDAGARFVAALADELLQMHRDRGLCFSISDAVLAAIAEANDNAVLLARGEIDPSSLVVAAVRRWRRQLGKVGVGE